MQVDVMMAVKGYFNCTVEVPEDATREEIRKAAEAMFSEADFGELEDIENRALTWTGEDDNMHEFDIIETA
jgi:hypothetical protein